MPPTPTSSPSTTLPSLRLKVIRDGLQDLALLNAARRRLATGKVRAEHRQRLSTLLDPVPGLFTHPHYFDRLPETLLARRRAILELLASP